MRNGGHVRVMTIRPAPEVDRGLSPICGPSLALLTRRPAAKLAVAVGTVAGPGASPNREATMATRLIDANWASEIDAGWRLGADPVRIIAPFIKEGVVARLLAASSPILQVVTRYNLDDFASGVSDIAALRKLLNAGAQVRGIKGLHAKVYLFGMSRAIVTSANLTRAALERNYEFGILSEEATVISACQSYFNDLWTIGRDNLAGSQLDDWEQRVRAQWASRPQQPAQPLLGDFGAVATGPQEPILLPVSVTDAPQAFVKFLGEGDNRVATDFPVLEEIASAGCHWALAYPASKRPRGVKDGAIMFIGRLTYSPNDIRIFGRGIGTSYSEGVDDASAEEIAARDWKANWPRYIRVHDTDFVAGTMANGVSLNELMDTLGSNSFAPTQRNAAAGIGNVNPRKSFQQQAAVELTPQATDWLSSRLEQALRLHGRVPPSDLAGLD